MEVEAVELDGFDWKSAQFRRSESSQTKGLKHRCISHCYIAITRPLKALWVM